MQWDALNKSVSQKTTFKNHLFISRIISAEMINSWRQRKSGIYVCRCQRVGMCESLRMYYIPKQVPTSTYGNTTMILVYLIFLCCPFCFHPDRFDFLSFTYTLYFSLTLESINYYYILYFIFSSTYLLFSLFSQVLYVPRTYKNRNKFLVCFHTQANSDYESNLVLWSPCS